MKWWKRRPDARTWRERVKRSYTWMLGRVTVRIRDYPVWERCAAVGVILLAFCLDFARIGSDRAINTYYAAAVRSMLTSWHAFFYASFDPYGYVSVDKPPLGLWLQAISAKLVGFGPVALILPQAIAGVLSVALLYGLARRTFGSAAGLLAGALLAISPINVVANRDNVFESLLVLSSLGAVWGTLRSVESGRFRWLALCGVCLGLGFTMKTLEAYLVLPSCALMILLGSAGAWRRRLAHLAGWVGVVMVASFWWIVAVDLTPATQRPYVDSTLTNSELDLAFNYNGLQRLFGQPHYSNATHAALSDAGAPGLLRLFQPHLGSQISWLLPVALVGLLSSVWAVSARTDAPGLRGWVDGATHRQLMMWGSWLAVAGGFFTVALFYNRYYLVMVAPAICSLAAIGVVGLWRDYWAPGWRRWLAPIAVFATGAEQRVILAGFADWNAWLSPTLYVATGLAVVLLVVRNLAPRSRAKSEGVSTDAQRIDWARVGVGLALATLTIAPLCWLGASFGSGNEGGFPISGPVADASPAAAVDPRLVAYLRAHASGVPYIVATVRATDAAPIMLATGDAALALGGYSGYDPILTPASLAALVKRGDVRYFLLPATNMTLTEAQALYPASAMTFSTRYTNRLTQWVGQTCVAVAPSAWQTSVTLGAMQVFDCAAVAYSSPNAP